jgi:PST family polysaccharide transporter
LTERAGKPRYYGKLAKVGLVWGFVREGANFLLQLPTAIVLARLLTPHESGVAAAAYFFMQLCARLTQFGFGVALVRAKTVTQEHVASVFVMNLALGTVAWAALTFGAPAFGAFFHSPETAAVLPTVAVGFFVVAFASVPTALLSRDMRYRESATSDWMDTAAASIVSITLAWNGWSYWSIIYGTLAGDTTRALVRAVMTRWRPSLKFSREAMREMFSFGSGIYAKNLLDYAVQNLDNLVVGRLIGITALGFYDKAYSTMARVLTKINLAGPSVSFRIFALIHDEPDRFRKAYRKVVLSVTLVGYPMMSGMIVVGPELIEVMYGKRWLPAVIPFQILCAAAMLRLLNTYASTATQATGQIWSEVQRQVLFVVVLVASVAGFSKWGIGGAALGVLVATAFMTLLMQILVRRFTTLHWADLIRPQVPAIVCSAGLATLVMLTKGLIRTTLPNVPAAVVLIACAVLGGLYYLVFLVAAPFSDVRVVVQESAHDLVPSLAKRVPWLAPSPKEVPAWSAQ